MHIQLAHIQLECRMLILLTLFATSTVSRALPTVACSRAVACPGSVVTCECAEALGFLEWRVQPGSNCVIQYSASHMPIGVSEEICETASGHQAVLEEVEIRNFGVFASSLSVTVVENLTVTCASTLGPESTSITLASEDLATTLPCMYTKSILLNYIATLQVLLLPLETCKPPFK